MKFGVELEVLQNYVSHNAEEKAQGRLVLAKAFNKHVSLLMQENPVLTPILKKDFYKFKAKRRYKTKDYFNNANTRDVVNPTWEIEYDSSVIRTQNNNASYNESTEIISPPMNIWAASPQEVREGCFGPTILAMMLNKVIKKGVSNTGEQTQIRYKSNITSSTHVHISCIDEGQNYFLVPRYLLSICLHWVKFQDVFMSLTTKERIQGKRKYYCKPNKLPYIWTMQNIVEALQSPVQTEALKEIMLTFCFDEENPIYMSRNYALNLDNLKETKSGTIECRLYHGTIDPQEITNWTLLLCLLFDKAIYNVENTTQSTEEYLYGLYQSITQLKNSKSRMQEFFNDIIRHPKLKAYYMQMQNTQSNTQCKQITDTEVESMLNMLQEPSFWKSPISQITGGYKKKKQITRMLNRRGKTPTV
jgi:hypothetical protein